MPCCRSWSPASPPARSRVRRNGRPMKCCWPARCARRRGVGQVAGGAVPPGVLVFCSLPIVMLCIPLGGVSLYEVLATYCGMAASVTLFGMILRGAQPAISPAPSRRLVVSYLVILPLSLVGVLFYANTSGYGRLVLIGVCCRSVLGGLRCVAECDQPPAPASARRGRGGQGRRRPRFRAEDGPWAWSSAATSSRQAVSPRPKRSDLMADGVNPIFDKEMRANCSARARLMLRLVIQLKHCCWPCR